MISKRLFLLLTNKSSYVFLTEICNLIFEYYSGNCRNKIEYLLKDIHDVSLKHQFFEHLLTMDTCDFSIKYKFSIEYLLEDICKFSLKYKFFVDDYHKKWEYKDNYYHYRKYVLNTISDYLLNDLSSTFGFSDFKSIPLDIVFYYETYIFDLISRFFRNRICMEYLSNIKLHNFIKSLQKKTRVRYFRIKFLNMSPSKRKKCIEMSYHKKIICI